MGEAPGGIPFGPIAAGVAGAPMFTVTGTPAGAADGAPGAPATGTGLVTVCTGGGGEEHPASAVATARQSKIQHPAILLFLILILFLKSA